MCLNIKLCFVSTKQMLVIFQPEVVGRGGETQLQVGESFKVYPPSHPPTPFGKNHHLIKGFPSELVIYWGTHIAQYALDCRRKPLQIKKCIPLQWNISLSRFTPSPLVSETLNLPPGATRGTARHSRGGDNQRWSTRWGDGITTHIVSCLALWGKKTHR